jgi:hypothetical protein
MKKLDTKLFSTGAEFLVMSRLLLANIQTYKTYVNFEGYDLVCVNPLKNCSAKIQVKSKNFVNDSSFYLNTDTKNKSDFYVFAQTNSIKKDKGSNSLVFNVEPKLYVIDFATINKYKKTDKNGSPWISISKKNIPNIDSYLNNWESIKSFLKLPIFEI